MVDERRAGLAVARDHVQDAGRETGLERELAEAQRGQRRLLGRLQHHRAARGERRREPSTTAIISGKFHGMIWPATPTGSLRV